MKSSFTNILFSLLSLVLFACVSQEKIQQPVVKIQKQQNCSPTQWRGIPIDTSQEYKSVADWFYVFEPVKRINTIEDEWHLAFLDSTYAILTYNDNLQQTSIAVRFSSETSASFSSGITIPFSGHIGSFSLNRNNIFFAAAPYSSNPNDITGNSKIYSGKFSKNIISNIEQISSINPHYQSWESHPAISPNGKVLFFASDRLSYKGVDLWFSVLQSDGHWSEPINCGDSVNTECDEITPFVTFDGTQLLFSSNGHETVGGYDLLSSNISPEFWKACENFEKNKEIEWGKFFSIARNLRPPTNTPADEIFPSTPTDPANLLYYSSNQFASQASPIFRRGGFDIYCRYKFTKAKPVAEKRKPTEPTLVVETPQPNIELPKLQLDLNFTLFGYVYDLNTKQSIGNANVFVFQIDTVTLTLPDLNATAPTKQTKTDKMGYFEIPLLKGFDYQVFAEAERYFYDSKRIGLEIGDTTRKVRLDFYLPLQFILRINFPFDVYDRPYKFVLDSNGVETNITWEEELDLLALNIKNSRDYIQKIVLVGHTDDVGTVEYNIRLAQNRVNFIINQLIKRGVDPKILEGISAGKSEPLLRRQNEDIETYRKRLRRVELRKIY